jgi:hypothetical protein
MQRRETRELDLTWIDENQFRAALADRLLHLQTNDRMRLCGVTSGYKEDICQMNICDGISHRARTQGCRQTGDRAGVSEPRAVIDVVGTEQAARHLL